MATDTTPHAAPDLTLLIERAMRTGATLSWVEENIIDPAPLESDMKAALWLFAWCQLSRRTQSREVSAMLDAIGAEEEELG